MKLKTSELTGAALDWAVAKCEGAVGMNDRLAWYTPSTNWAQGGPIIEREKICPCPSDHPVGERWNATDFSGHVTALSGFRSKNGSAFKRGAGNPEGGAMNFLIDSDAQTCKMTGCSARMR